MVEDIKDLEEFKKVLSENQVVVADFYASWCPPCHAIAAPYAKLAETYSDSIAFRKCNVDTAADVALECKITAMPTFVFYREGKRVETIQGADAKSLESAVEKYASIMAPADDQAQASEKQDAPRDTLTFRSIVRILWSGKVLIGLIALSLALWFFP